MRSKRGFTLIELLAVVAMIALLVALLLPAVQSARAAARRVQCANRFREVALAVLNYSSTTDMLPALKNPNFYDPARYEPHRSGGKSRLDMSWKLTVLPFLEERSLYEQLADPANWRFELRVVSAASRPCVVPTFLCPATPASPELSLYRKIVSSNGQVLYDGFATPQVKAAGWVQDQAPEDWRSKSSHGAWIGTKVSRHMAGIRGQAMSEGKGYLEYYGTKLPAKLKWITDGFSKTILVSEVAGSPHLIVKGKEQLRPNWYGAFLRAESSWVHRPLLIRYDSERHMTLGLKLGVNYLSQPVNYSNYGQIFSFHPGGAHVSMCDGAVRFLSEATAPSIAFELATRASYGH